MEAEILAFIANLEMQPSISRNTRSAYESDLRNFTNYMHRMLRRSPTLTDFDTQIVTSYLETEHQRGRQPNTILRHLATLRRFEIFLRQEGYLEDDSGICNFQPESSLQAISGVPRPQYLTPDQIQRLWKTIGNSSRPQAKRDHAILALLLDSGLTVSTLISLNLPDLNLRTGRIYLSINTNEDFWFSLRLSVAPLEKYLKEGRPELNPKIDQSALFISQIGTRMSRQGVWQTLRHWGKVADLPIGLSPRLVRNTAVIQMALTGHSLPEIQILIGHRNALSTQALIQRMKSTGIPRPGSYGE